MLVFLIGAFYTGCAVQPVALKYPNRLVSDQLDCYTQSSQQLSKFYDIVSDNNFVYLHQMNSKY